MRQGFTLIELMIVIAIIAIIAAIAIPNLLESRITANESSAAASLKSGFLPGQAQFQAGGYIDVDGNGRGIYGLAPTYLAGTTTAATAPAINEAPNKKLALLDPAWNNQSAPAAAGAVPIATVTAANNGGAGAAGTALTSHGPYNFGIVLDTTTESNAESYWGAYAVPQASEATTTYDGANGRRSFGINAGGAITQTKGSVTYAKLNWTTVTAFATVADALFATDPRLTNAAPGGAGAPYIK